MIALLILAAAGEPLTLGGERLRMDGEVQAVAFSPDGKLLATAGQARRVVLWDTATGKEARGFDTGGYSVHWLAFSPDGKRLFLGGSDSSVRVLDSVRGSLLARLADPERSWGAPMLALSADGRALVMLSPFGQEALVFDTARARPPRVIRGVPGRTVGQLTLTPDGKFLVLPWSDGRLHLVDLEKGVSARCLEPDLPVREPGRFPRVTGLAVSPDGGRVAYRSADEKELVVREVKDGKRIEGKAGRIPIGGEGGMEALSGGLVAARRGDAVEAWRLADGERAGVFSMPGLSAWAASRDGQRLAACAGHAAVIWDVASGRKAVASEGHHRPVERLVFTHGGRRLVSMQGGEWRLWGTEAGRLLCVHAGMPGPPLTSPRLREGGRALEMVGRGRAVWRWEVGTEAATPQTEPRKLFHHSSEAVSRDGRLMAGTSLAFGDLRVEALTGPEWRLSLGRLPTRHGNVLAFSPDGTTLAVGSGDQSLLLFSVAEGGRPLRLPASGEEEPGGGGSHVVFRPDGRVIARYDGRLRLIETASAQVRLRIPAEREPPGAAPEWSPDGRLIALASGDGVVVLDGLTGKEVMRQRLGQSGARALAFSPDGRRLATAGQDTTIRLWPVPSPPPLPRDGSIAAAWEALREGTAEEAGKALARLMAEPGASARRIAEWLRPARGVSEEELTRLTRMLESSEFRERERAARRLEEVGEAARAALLRAAKEGGEESRRAVRGLLERLDGQGARLREARAVEALEMLGAREALRGVQGRARPLAEEALRRLEDARLGAGLQ
jgi:WD40 repeat protein